MAGSLKSTGPAGPIILSVFGAIWAVLGLLSAGAAQAWIAVPVVIAVVLIAIVGSRSRGLAPRSAEEGARIGKLVGVWSGVEGVGIFVAINICARFGRPDLYLAAICLVVGLHFVPLARGLPVRLYYQSAALMSALGIAGLVDSALVAPSVVAFGAALVLWGTVLRVLG